MISILPLGLHQSEEAMLKTQLDLRIILVFDAPKLGSEEHDWLFLARF